MAGELLLVQLRETLLRHPTIALSCAA